ncbi:hypothetical protein OEZ86_010560 [Tetradesmus obliquus]|nr:hypothetical protein OEZ86_010560 [Tetradesmus obliquus]
MGYGKNGRSGSAFQWWIPLLSALVAVGGFIAWAVFAFRARYSMQAARDAAPKQLPVTILTGSPAAFSASAAVVLHQGGVFVLAVFAFRARNATQAALDAAGLRLEWWAAQAAVLLATAVCFPVLTLLALGVSLWRAHLARQLNIHAPTKRWARRSKAWQTANVASSCLLYGVAGLMVASLAAHAVWAFSAAAAHYGAYYAIKYVDPVWGGVGRVVNASEALVGNFLGLAAQLPVVGGRRLAEYDPAAGQIVITRRLTQADVDAMPAATREAGLAAGRALQQLPDLVNGLGGLLNTAANAIGSANVVPAQVGAQLANLRDLPFLPQLLPNGTDNPLFSTLSSVTEAVQGQLLGRSGGCPGWCVDLRDQSWIKDGCLCNLDRVKAAYPHLGPIYRNAVPAAGMVVAMLAAATWLLLHAASQWARTRSEAKLLTRLPNAAQLAAAAHSGNGGAAAAAGRGKGLPVTQMDASALPAV